MITVIADDLTGAAEIVGICLRYRIDVSFGIDTIAQKEAQVTVIATDTRSLSENEAYKIHQLIAKNIIEEHYNQIIFKKCDSVLRGHVLTELSALMNVSGKRSVLLQPSNPVGNRCIQNGIYFVNNEEIKKTGFSTDPDFPAKTSSVKNLISDRSSKKNEIKIYTGSITSINSDGIYVPDCNCENELYENLQLYSDEFLIGGSAAFFEQFLINRNIASAKKTTKIFNFSNNYILVSGSTHPKSIAFASMLQSKNCPILQFPEELLLEEIETSFLNKWIEKLSEIYDQNRKLGLRISNNIVQFNNSSKVLKSRLSIVVKQLLELSNSNELFIEGGATAYDVLKKLNWNAFTPVDELALGVVRMQYNNDKSKHITIKPGSYQWPENVLN